MQTLHEEAKAYATANNWPWAYALGYASGIEDSRHNRPNEHKRDNDDYAKGYNRGYAEA